MMNICDRVKSFLSQKKVEVPREWIVACIEWLQEEHSQSQNVGNSAWLSQKAYDQWLHTDLSELGCSSVAVALTEQRSATLPRDTVLQVNSVREVGLPAYSQLQQLRKDDTENTLIDTDQPKQQAWEPKPSRMLLLTVTDGVTELQGMEYSPVAALSVHTKPGTKVVVKQGTSVRRGVLLLTASHLAVLGGAVDALLTTNAPENVINRQLRLPETDSPREYDEPPGPPPSLPPSQASQYYPTPGGGAPQRANAAASTAQQQHSRAGVSSASQQSRGRNSAPQHANARSRPISTGRGNGPSQATFDNLWANSQNFGRPADRSQRSVAEHVAEFADEDFLDEDLEAALLETECMLLSANSGATDLPVRPAVTARAAVPANGSAARCNSVVPTIAGALHCRPSVNTAGAIGGAVNKLPNNESFVDITFDDDLDEQEITALEEKVKLVESMNFTPSNSRSEPSVAPRIENKNNFLKPAVPAFGSKNKFSIRNENYKSNISKPMPNFCDLTDTISDAIKSNNSTRFKDINSVLVSSNAICNNSKNVGSLAASTHQQSSNINSSGTDSAVRLAAKRCSNANSDEEAQHQSKLPKLTNNQFKSENQPPVGASAADSSSDTISSHRETAVVTPVARRISSEEKLPPASSAFDRPLPSDGAEKSVARAVQSEPPFTYLCFLPETSTSQQEFVIKGFVMTLMSRLDPSSGLWRLPVKINDGTRSLGVDIDDGVLQKLIGMSVSEMKAHKARASTDPTVKAMLSKSVSGCQRELISLCCLLTVRVAPALPRPLVVTLSPVTEEHATQLLRRRATPS